MNALGLSKLLIVTSVSSTSLYTSVVGSKFLKENLTSLVRNIQPLMESKPSSPTKKSSKKPTTPITKSKGNEKDNNQKSKHPCDHSSSSFSAKLFRALRPCRPKALQVNLKPEKMKGTKHGKR